ncbi:hypothetical protein [Paenibacillus urinalis]|uniref:Polymer-forming cytoskeletal protein n=1 Tax=Paenibacillus urinalis TaxID=521520 RepID=A0AAX3MY74_9BACL|nr:hypothetical protein [Paenibacillus urinalis]WDH82217.1 hypothetical protein PUW23_22645 [Paenibacillus urinalis]
MITGNHELNSDRKSDVRMIGEGDSAGGAYRKIRIMGQGRIDGDASCETFRCTGDASLQGQLSTPSFKLLGNMHIKGGLSGDTAITLGELRIDGTSQVRHMKLIGAMKVGQNLRGEKLKCSGQLQIQGDCSSEEMRIRGVITAEGAVNAERIQIKLNGPSHVREIGGAQIDVQQASLSWFPILRSKRVSKTLTADLIEGDNIRLEHVEAKVVRGRHVTIGPGCRIGLVEYKEKYKEHHSAKVGESVRH